MRTLTKNITLVLLLLAGPGLLWALRVTPTYQVFRLKAGSKTIGQLTLTNSDESDLTVTPRVQNFYSLPENKKIKTTDWLKIDEKPFVLKRGESKQISFNVHPPKNAKGELAGTLHFDTKGPQVVSLALSLAIYAAIEGTEKPKFEIPAISVDISTHTNFSVMVLNTGNIHFRPRGFLQVYNSDDQLVMNAEIYTGQPALPGQPRVYTSTVKNYRLPEGKYRADVGIEDVDWGFQFPVEEKKFSIDKEGKAAAR